MKNAKRELNDLELEEEKRSIIKMLLEDDCRRVEYLRGKLSFIYYLEKYYNIPKFQKFKEDNQLFS